MTQHCNGPDCDAQIVFAVNSDTGKAMPMNAQPEPGGEWILFNRDGVVYCSHDPSVRDRADIGRKSHFATCPNAGAFRSRSEVAS